MLLTLLYVPGDRPERFAKAVASGADAVILDLEDGVALSRKAYARTAVRDFLAGTWAVPTFVRVNVLDDIFDAPGVAGWRLPKVESRAQVLAASALTHAPLHCLIESALGLEAVLDIARVAGVEAIGLGEEDLRSDLGIASDDGLLWARSRIVVAARAAGLPPPAMSVYSDLSDLDGLTVSCARGRRLGFLGRTALHPKQLPAIVAGFRPPADEVAHAQALLESVTEDSGALVLPDGRFADRALVAAAERVVALDAHCAAAAAN